MYNVLYYSCRTGLHLDIMRIAHFAHVSKERYMLLCLPCKGLQYKVQNSNSKGA